ncbi:GNAT family N-acetyltransferase [Streptomyces sp. NPDC056470]|uniref:GNAT family N-acetyltransferase n=1 Tax=Streptomyces sp. NPDC056470 TaxID=3345831 RepID=UPI0036CEF6C8
MIDIQHHDHRDAATLRPLLLDIYAEVYKDVQDDPFASVNRFAQGLDGWSNRPGWSCVIGYDRGEAVGYAYGAPLPQGAAWWRGLLTPVPADVVEETGERTYALSELMVRLPWRGTGAAKALHDALLTHRDEERATLLVEQAHPKVRALYEGWGWRKLGDLRPRFDGAPLFDAMLLPLTL